MEATARNLLESYCSFYAGLWSDTVPLFINTKYPTQQAKDGAITGLICNIMNPTDFTGCGIFKTAYMRKRCLLLASVAFPDFQRIMYERYPEYCTEDYKAKAILEVQKLDAKDRIKKAKEELKKNLVEHKKATNLLKKTIKKITPPACTFCPTQASISVKDNHNGEDWFCRKCFDEIYNPQ